MEILVGDTIYFEADWKHGNELWAHDTSNSSTWMVAISIYITFLVGIQSTSCDDVFTYELYDSNLNLDGLSTEISEPRTLHGNFSRRYITSVQ